MTNSSVSALKSALILLVISGMPAAAAPEKDLSRYRGFQLGWNLADVAKQAGISPSEAKVIHRHPALIEELNWRPPVLSSSSQTDSVQEVVFRFYEGELFQITVNYDKYETEGMTADDFIRAISTTYGTSEKPTPPVSTAKEQYEDKEEIAARWQNSQYSFDLIRSSYGPRFKMVGVLKRLEAPAQTAINEAKRLDVQDAPQRAAAHEADVLEAARAKLEQARLLNQAKFRQ